MRYLRTRSRSTVRPQRPADRARLRRRRWRAPTRTDQARVARSPWSRRTRGSVTSASPCSPRVPRRGPRRAFVHAAGHRRALVDDVRGQRVGAGYASLMRVLSTGIRPVPASRRQRPPCASSSADRRAPGHPCSATQRSLDDPPPRHRRAGQQRRPAGHRPADGAGGRRRYWASPARPIASPVSSLSVGGVTLATAASLDRVADHDRHGADAVLVRRAALGRIGRPRVAPGGSRALRPVHGDDQQVASIRSHSLHGGAGPGLP